MKPKVIPHIRGQALDVNRKPVPYYPIRLHADGGAVLADVLTDQDGIWVWQDEYAESLYVIYGPDEDHVEIEITASFPPELYEKHLYAPYGVATTDKEATDRGVEKGQCYACQWNTPYMVDIRGNHRHYLLELEEKLQWGYPKNESKKSSKRS